MKKSMDMIQFESRAEIGGRAGETDETALSRGKAEPIRRRATLDISGRGQ